MGMYESGGSPQPSGAGCVWSTELRAWVVERDGRRLRFDDALRRWVDVGPSAVVTPGTPGATMRLTDPAPNADPFRPRASDTQSHGYATPAPTSGKAKGIVIKLSAAFVALLVVGFGSFRVAGAIGGDGPTTTITAAPQPPSTPPPAPPDDGKAPNEGNDSGAGCRKPNTDLQQDLVPAGANPNVPRTSPTTNPKSSTTTKPRKSCQKQDEGTDSESGKGKSKDSDQSGDSDKGKGTDSDKGEGTDSGNGTDSDSGKGSDTGKGSGTDENCGHDARMRLTVEERTTTTRRPKTTSDCGTAPKTTDTTDTRPRILVAAVDATTGESVSGNWKIQLKSVSTGQTDESNEPNSPGAVWRVKPGRYAVEFTPAAGYVVVDDGGKPHAGVTITVTVSSGDELIKIKVARG